MEVTSSAFQNNQPIPSRYTCDGEDLSPPLDFHQVPADAKSLVVIVDDPDAPMGTFDHWIAWNLPATTAFLAEGADIPKEGRNDFRETGYRGPCPPPGPAHRYFFKVYALDTMLDIAEGSTKQQLEEAMEGHILAHAELVGTFQR